MSAPARFLPDLRQPRALFALVLSTQLLALVLALTLSGAGRDPWHDLAHLSVLILWITLLSALGLIGARPWLLRYSAPIAGLIAWLVVVAATTLVSLLAWELATQGGQPPQPEQLSHYLIRNGLIAAIVGAATLRYLYLQQQLQQRSRGEALARLEALRARIRPHFLFNALNTIASLARHRPAQAEGAVLDLAELLRASLATGDRTVPLAEELRLAHRYLAIEALRLGDRLQLEWPEERSLPSIEVPPLSIQPLVENAIHHGIERCPEGGQLRLAVTQLNGTVRLTIRNPLPADSAAEDPPGLHMALDNVRQRLHAGFGEQARLASRSEAGWYTVELTLPCA